MDISRKANRVSNERTLQFQSRHNAARIEEVIADKLAHLLVLMGRLEQTPAGAADLQRRAKLFGACQRMEGETSGQFYARLRHWLNRAIPQTKLPLHAPRQAGV